MSKIMTLPNVESATRQAINSCYGDLITNDPRWIIGLPEFAPIKRKRKKPIQLIYSRANPRLRCDR